MQEKIQLITVLSILSVSTASIRRLIRDDNFPKPEKIGNQLYFETSLVYKWLSTLADRSVAIGDKLLSSKQLEALFNRSSAWVWVHFQKNRIRKEKAIYIRSRPMWLESDIQSDKDLSKYLELLESEKVQEVA